MIKKRVEQIEDFQLNKSTNIDDKSILYKRARAKYFTLGLMFGMVDLNSELKKGYWNTYYCACSLTKENGKITAKYCKNRWCLVCNRIRTAINYKKYFEQIKTWDDKYFVTLTFPNVHADMLEFTIDEMLKNFLRIRKLFHQRKMDFVGIRKLECTYNPERIDYHPHFHLIIRGQEQSKELVSQWLLKYPEAEEFCQDIAKADDKSTSELFKYFTKLISSKHDKKFDINKAPIEYRRKIYIDALDVVFNAVKGRRTFQNFGFKADKVNEKHEETIETNEICDKIQYFDWNKELNDWFNRDTGELLTGYMPTEAMEKLINSIVTKKEDTL